jgi:thiol:disulfide interchange protein DsbD
LVVDGKSYEVFSKLNGGGVAEASTQAPLTQGLSLLILLMAFGGGLLLNLMPCVLPVLSVKILHVVDQPQGKSPLGSSLAYTLGVLVSFWVLAAVILSFRAAGEELGWGFQLKNPWVVYALMVTFLVFALNLFGLFEVGLSLVGIDQKAKPGHGVGASFFSGVLASVAATPCSAPFMGTAVGATLTLAPFSAVLVFTALGLGMAFPFLLAGFVPAWTKYLPKPGAWMLTFKQVLGFVLMGTVAFMLYIMSVITTDSEYLLWVCLSLVVISVGLWIWGKWALPGMPHAGRYRVLGWAMIVLAILMVVPEESYEDEWRPFSEAEIQKTLANGQAVFVDFTAKWCLSCKVNEKAVLSRPETFELFRSQNMVPFKADWTKADPVITKALEKLGRNSVPVYVIYRPEAPTKPVLLPQVLTTSIFESYVKK